MIAILTLLIFTVRACRRESWVESNIRVWQHHLIVISPLLALGFVRLVQWIWPENAGRLIALYVGLQMVLAISLLRFLDARDGAPGADFGLAYRAISAGERAALIEETAPSARRDSSADGR